HPRRRPAGEGAAEGRRGLRPAHDGLRGPAEGVPAACREGLPRPHPPEVPRRHQLEREARAGRRGDAPPQDEVVRLPARGVPRPEPEGRRADLHAHPAAEPDAALTGSRRRRAHGARVSTRRLGPTEHARAPPRAGTSPFPWYSVPRSRAASAEGERMPDDSSNGDGLLAFLWRNKIWWLTPAIAVLV